MAQKMAAPIRTGKKISSVWARGWEGRRGGQRNHSCQRRREQDDGHGWDTDAPKASALRRLIIVTRFWKTA